MPDNFKKVRPGEQVNFSAQVWNAILDAADAEQRRKQNRDFNVADQSRQTALIKIKNESGGALPQFSVIGLDTPIFLPSAAPNAYMQQVTFRGVMPTAAHVGRFAILLDPLNDHAIGRAFVSDLCQVKIHVADETHTCADIQAGITSSLITMSVGASAQILWKEDPQFAVNGERWAIVRLENNCPGPSTTPTPTPTICGCSSGVVPSVLTYTQGTSTTVFTYQAPPTAVTHLPIIDASGCGFINKIAWASESWWTTPGNFVVNQGCDPTPPGTTLTVYNLLFIQSCDVKIYTVQVSSLGRSDIVGAPLPSPTVVMYTGEGSYIHANLTAGSNTCNPFSVTNFLTGAGASHAGTLTGSGTGPTLSSFGTLGGPPTTVP